MTSRADLSTFLHLQPEKKKGLHREGSWGCGQKKAVNTSEADSGDRHAAQRRSGNGTETPRPKEHKNGSHEMSGGSQESKEGGERS